MQKTLSFVRDYMQYTQVAYAT